MVVRCRSLMLQLVLKKSIVVDNAVQGSDVTIALNENIAQLQAWWY